MKNEEKIMIHNTAAWNIAEEYEGIVFIKFQ